MIHRKLTTGMTGSSLARPGLMLAVAILTLHKPISCS